MPPQRSAILIDLTGVAELSAPPALDGDWYSNYLLYWYKSTNTDAQALAAASASGQMSRSKSSSAR
jgi:hypothetical protein